MKKIVLCVSMLLLSFVAKAEEPTTVDRGMEAAAMVLLAADWNQTRQIAQQPKKYYETNRILGDHPSVGSVNTYFVATMLTTAILTEVLPDTYRKILLSGIIVVEVWAVSNNKVIGLNVKF